MSGGSQTDIDNLVNQIRTRAGLGTISNVTLDQLLEEARHEFMSEGRRWHHLVRTGKVLTVMNNWIAAEDDLRANYINPITANHIVYPIPQVEIAANPVLQQNQWSI